MDILKVAFNKITQKIAYHLFKKKFNGWCDQKEVNMFEQNTSLREDMIHYLSHHAFDEAFESYLNMLRLQDRLFKFQQFKQYVFNKDENNEH